MKEDICTKINLSSEAALILRNLVKVSKCSSPGRAFQWSIQVTLKMTDNKIFLKLPYPLIFGMCILHSCIELQHIGKYRVYTL